MNTEQMVKEIRVSWTTETGEDPGRVGAEVILDRMCDAFVHKVEGAGYAYAVREQPEIANYLVWQWKGGERKALRAAMTAAGQ